jgi:hypothetical protein
VVHLGDSRFYSKNYKKYVAALNEEEKVAEAFQFFEYLDEKYPEAKPSFGNTENFKSDDHKGSTDVSSD